ncbi:MAG: hypothetical protein IPK26_27870 [Planctomycetes bacterium]|nr:hypothetical protein [Planctomycetota bacterium]
MTLAAGMRVLVHGLGRFGGGLEAIRFLHRRGCNVRIADKNTGPDLDHSRQALAGLPDLDWQLGREDEALLHGIDLFVANPAVPDHHPLLAAARKRGLPVTQEVDLFLSAYPGTVVAITGTNGKSTTSTLTHAALQRGGQPALLGGNIGHSLLADEAAWERDQVAVLEISSFQLERLDPCSRVHGAVFTRVLKDHVDRHGTLDAYHAARAGWRPPRSTSSCTPPTIRSPPRIQSAAPRAALRRPNRRPTASAWSTAASPRPPRPAAANASCTARPPAPARRVPAGERDGRQPPPRAASAPLGMQSASPWPPPRPCRSGCSCSAWSMASGSTTTACPRKSSRRAARCVR